MSGPDKFLNFLKKGHIYLKQLEPISLAGVTGLNKDSLKQFYEEVAEALSRHPLDVSKICNRNDTERADVLKQINCT
jgi:hypothetical protein